jgi:thymidylate kinase
MPLVLVTGLSGSGKSAVYRRLVERGIEAYGFDEHGFGEWFSRTSRKATPFPVDRTDGDTAELEFRVHRDRIERLAADVRASGRTVYLCGGAGHELHFWELLDLVVYLDVDGDTLRRRLTSRTDNGYGKTADELDGILSANETWAAMYADRGAVVVDAARPLEQVVDDVIRLTPAAPT